MIMEKNLLILNSRLVTYNFENGDAANYSFKDEIPAGIYADFCISLSEVDV